MDPREEGYIRTLYATEVLHKKVYAHFAEGESEPRLRQVLKRLSDIEQGHADSWSGLLGKGAHLPSGAYIGLQASLVYLLRRVLGLALAVKIIEYREQIVYNELNRRLEQMGDRKHAKSMSDMEVAMEGEEESLKRKVIEHSPVLNNIRDVILGANDGLVEILAATAGLGIVLRNPTLVLLSGLIVAVAGTLSMAGGVYLSVEYEKSIGIVKTESPLKSSSAKSAFYVGLSYILGSMAPLFPFMLGFAGYVGVAISIVITAIVLTFVSALISIVSDTSIKRRMLRTLAISLGIAAVTIIIGTYARGVLNLPYT